MEIEITYAAGPHEQLLFAINVPENCTVEEAIKYAESTEAFPQLLKLMQVENTQALAILPMGVFGQRVKLNEKLKHADRIEIYRPLKVDPKQARRIRAKKLNSD